MCDAPDLLVSIPCCCGESSCRGVEVMLFTSVLPVHRVLGAFAGNVEVFSSPCLPG